MSDEYLAMEGEIGCFGVESMRGLANGAWYEVAIHQ